MVRREIADFLDDPPALSSPERRRLLVELICIDLEFRWRDVRRDPSSHERIMLEGYVAKFPELSVPRPIAARAHRRGVPGASPMGRSARRMRNSVAIPRAAGTDPGRAARGSTASSRRRPIRVPRHVGVRIVSAGGNRRSADPDAPLLSHHDFLLRRLIGAGRMGKVYQAWQHSTRPRGRREVPAEDRSCKSPGSSSGSSARRGPSPGCAIPNIVGTQGLGRTPGGAYFIVMDLVDGPNLAQLGRTQTHLRGRGHPLDHRDLPGPRACARDGDHPLRSQAGQSPARCDRAGSG